VRRSKVEVVADILGATNGVGATKTQIVYRANLNFKLATKYLRYLIEKGYITEDERNGKKVFLATSKGQAFLRKFFEIARDLEDLV
jgi:predicted transcriptional regulator